MKILFLAPFPPRRDAAHGGGRCIARLLLDLSARHRAGLIYFREPADEPLDPTLKRQFEFTVEVPRGNGPGSRIRVLHRLAGGDPVWTSILRTNSFRRQVADAVQRWRPDVVQAEFLAMGQYLDAAPESQRVLRVHDTGVSVARERLAASRGVGRLRLRADLHAWERYEPQVCGWADSIVVFTERDRRELAGGAAEGRTRIIPPDVDCPARVLDPLGQEPPELLFVGNFAHRPNIEAARRLIESIFPEVQRGLPHARLRLIGPSPPDEISRHHGGSVIVAGQVDSVEPWLDRAAVFCAPLHSGGGIRMKVMEALAAGKAVVATPLALEGIDAEPGREVLAAEADGEFAAATLRLMKDPALRQAIAAGGRQWAERAAAISRSDAFDALYRELTERGRQPAAVGELAR
jgi:glycosyltransferase involved in cell wall biosynthesis